MIRSMTAHMGGFLWGHILLKWRFDFLVENVRTRNGCQCETLVERAASLEGGNDARLFLEHLESIYAWKREQEDDEPYMVGYWRAWYHIFKNVPLDMHPGFYMAHERPLIPMEWIAPAIAAGYVPALDLFLPLKHLFEQMSVDKNAQMLTKHWIARYSPSADLIEPAYVKIQKSDEQLAYRGSWTAIIAVASATPKTRVFWMFAQRLLTSQTSSSPVHFSDCDVIKLCKFDKYQFLLCVRQTHASITLGDLHWLGNIITPWTGEWRSVNVSPAEMVKWLLIEYDIVQKKIRLAIDTWTVCASRLGLVHDVRRLIAESAWQDRYEWA